LIKALFTTTSSHIKTHKVFQGALEKPGIAEKMVLIDMPSGFTANGTPC
jgi:hypothetical protein